MLGWTGEQSPGMNPGTMAGMDTRTSAHTHASSTRMPETPAAANGGSPASTAAGRGATDVRYRILTRETTAQGTVLLPGRELGCQDLTYLQACALEAATRAAVLVRRMRHQLSAPTVAGGQGEHAGHVPVAATKSSAVDPVTEVDRASEELIVALLHERTPGAEILGEEGGNLACAPVATEGSEEGGAAEGAADYTGVLWVVDPIDGTVNFIYGLPAYAVSVAATVDGVPVAGAVVDVAEGVVYSARQGGDALCWDVDLGVSAGGDADDAEDAEGIEGAGTPATATAGSEKIHGHDPSGDDPSGEIPEAEGATLAAPDPAAGRPGGVECFLDAALLKRLERSRTVVCAEAQASDDQASDDQANDGRTSDDQTSDDQTSGGHPNEDQSSQPGERGGGDAPRAARALVATGFGYDAGRRKRQADVLTRVLPQVRDIRRCGSAALDLCAVASGRVDAYYEHGLGPWDYAAGVLIAARAGAVVRVAGVDVLSERAALTLAGTAGVYTELLAMLESEGVAHTLVSGHREPGEAASPRP